MLLTDSILLASTFVFSFLISFLYLKLVNLPPVKQAIESLEKSDVNFQLFDDVRIEPTDSRLVLLNLIRSTNFMNFVLPKFLVILREVAISFHKAVYFHYKVKNQTSIFQRSLRKSWATFLKTVYI